MFSQLTDLKKAGLFYVLAMALDLIVVLYFLVAAPTAEIVVIVHMMTALLATVLMLYVFTRDGYSKDSLLDLGLRRSGRRAWGMALLLPLLVLSVSYGLAWLSGAATLVIPTENGGLTNLLINTLTNLLIVTLLVLSEEIGFRGYLLPRLLSIGTKRAIILSGFLFATWHLPLILLSPLFRFEGNPFLTTPIFLLLITAAGVIYAVLRLETNSIWPSTILHGMFNGLDSLFASLTMFNSSAAFYLVGESGLLTLVVTLAIALWLLHRMDPAVVPTPALEQA